MAVKKENILFCFKKGSSPLHRLAPGIKLLLCAVLCTAVFAGKSAYSLQEILCPAVLLRTGLCLALSLVLWVLSGAEKSSIINTKFVFIIGIILLALRCFKLENREIVFPYADGIAGAVFFTLKFFTAALAAQCVFQTTSPLQIQEFFETAENVLSKIFPPLKKLNVALTLSLTINFIPQVFSTWNKIQEAAAARSPKRKNIFSAARIFLAEFSALFSCMLRQAEEKRRAVINRLP